MKFSIVMTVVGAAVLSAVQGRNGKQERGKERSFQGNSPPEWLKPWSLVWRIKDVGRSERGKVWMSVLGGMKGPAVGKQSTGVVKSLGWF